MEAISVDEHKRMEMAKREKRFFDNFVDEATCTAMNTMIRLLRWFLQEFGCMSIHATGRDAYIVILCRTLRMFAHGAVTLILAPFLASLDTTPSSIGLFMTLTLLGDVFLGLYLTLIADRIGRRRVLLLGSFMMTFTGLIFALSSSYWALLLAAVFGVVSATGTDFGPFRSIEESINSEISTEKTRADLFTWYIMLSSVGSALGSEVCGRVVQGLKELEGWDVGGAYRVVFWCYMVVGAVNAASTLGLSERCEMRQGAPGGYQQVTQHEDGRDSDGIDLGTQDDLAPEEPPTERRPKPWWSRSLSTISAPTLAIIYKLWILLALESICEGMASYALTVYYMEEKFHPAKSTLGDVTSASYFLGATSSIFAGSLARRFGLVNTMVFSHAPSSAAIFLFPMPRSFVLTVMLLFVRTGLNNLDQAPRAAFIAAVARPDERTAVLGIAGMLRTIAAMPGPLVTGLLASRGMFGYAFVLAGAIRLTYDASLYVLFRKLEPVREEEEAISA